MFKVNNKDTINVCDKIRHLVTNIFHTLLRYFENAYQSFLLVPFFFYQKTRQKQGENSEFVTELLKSDRSKLVKISIFSLITLNVISDVLHA